MNRLARRIRTPQTTQRAQKTPTANRRYKSLGSETPAPSRSRRSALRVWIAALVLIVLASCERVPSKSDYVSARVTETCKEYSGVDLQACRIEVIKQFLDVSLEEMQQTYPKPVPRGRPGCNG